VECVSFAEKLRPNAIHHQGDNFFHNINKFEGHFRCDNFISNLTLIKRE
jgi:hypothetical protein